MLLVFGSKIVFAWTFFLLTVFFGFLAYITGVAKYEDKANRRANESLALLFALITILSFVATFLFVRSI